jgi:ADP-ribosylglycohydrolase
MTHGAPLAAGASAALASGIFWALRDKDPIAIADHMADAAGRYDSVTAAMLREVKSDAVAILDGRISAEFVLRDKLERWRGWAGHEAIATATLCFLAATLKGQAGTPFEDAVRHGANSPGDSDSIACIAGALAGAWLGVDFIPERWRTVIEGKQVLVDTAHRLFMVSGGAPTLAKTPRAEEAFAVCRDEDRQDALDLVAHQIFIKKRRRL